LAPQLSGGGIPQRATDEGTEEGVPMGTVKPTLIMIYFAEANTKCQLSGVRDHPHLVFALARLIMIKVNLTVPDPLSIVVIFGVTWRIVRRPKDCSS
jgi:hypothetical protein